MHRFLSRLFLFSGILLIFLYLISLPIRPAQNKSDYMAAIIDKHQRLATIPGRRILIAGGSSVAFGIDSKKIEDTFRIPVVNTALHAGLGLKFILNELEHVARPDDIILLSTEYYLANEDDLMRASTAHLFPEALTYFEHDLLLGIKIYGSNRLKQVRENATQLFASLTAKASAQAIEGLPVYARKSFNRYGDAIGHLDKPSPPHHFNEYPLSPYRYYEGIADLNSFYQSCQQRKIRVYFFFPVLAASKYRENTTSLARYQEDFSRDLQIPTLNTPATFALPDSLFFDTMYHLTKQGRAIRTAKMIELLQAAGLH